MASGASLPDHNAVRRIESCETTRRALVEVPGMEVASEALLYLTATIRQSGQPAGSRLDGRMRIEGARIGPLRQLHEPLELGLGSLNVLYGANGSGKTTILEALAAGGTTATGRLGRSTVESPPPATYYVRLSPEGDRDALLEILGGAGWGHNFKIALESAQKDVDPAATMTVLGDELDLGRTEVEEPRLDLAALAPEARESGLVDALLADVASERIDIAQQFCWAVIAEPLVAVQGARCWLAAARDDHVAAAERLAADPALAGTWLHRAANEIAFGGRRVVRLIRLGPPPEQLKPVVAWLDSDPSDLHADLQTLVPALFDSHWGVRSWSNGEHTWDRRGVSSAIDPWLDDDDEDGLRLRDRLRPVLDRVGELANDLVPAFVRREGVVVVRARPPGTWSRSPSRLQVVLRYDGVEDYWPEADLGGGMRSWVALCVREACRLVLDQAPKTVMNPYKGVWFTDVEGSDCEVMDDALADWPVEELEVTEWHEPKPALLLIDEPEAHLHPGAVTDAGNSLVELSARNRTIVLSTHSHQLLDLPTALLHAWRVHVESGSTAAEAISDSLLEAMWRLSGELGLRPSDILGLTKAVLLVEGKHDDLVLRTFYQRELQQHRILVLPISGTHNAMAVADGDFVARAGIPLYVLFDNAAANADASQSTPEALAVAELIATLEHRGVAATHIPFEDPDIIAAIPESSIRRAFPEARIKDWQPIISSWRALDRKPNFKGYALSTMGLAGGVWPTAFIEASLQARLDSEMAGRSLRRSISTLLAAVAAQR